MQQQIFSPDGEQDSGGACDCGEQTEAPVKELRAGKRNSCGHALVTRKRNHGGDIKMAMAHLAHGKTISETARDMKASRMIVYWIIKWSKTAQQGAIAAV